MKKFFWISIVLVIASILTTYYFRESIANYFKGNESYRSVEVNGKVMRAHVSGAGDKTIVMLSGWGVDSPIDDFFPLYTELSKEYKVVVLEYFGYSGSDTTNEERTNANIVKEVRTSLDKLGIKPPYILMPHSMSGLYSLYYAVNYPAEVSAIIGLDMSLPQKQLERWTEETFENTKSEDKLSKLNVSVVNQWNAFYGNSKELKDVKYPSDLPVLAFLATEQIDNIDNMVNSGEMRTSWTEMNKNMITNRNIQTIEILNGHHSELPYEQSENIINMTKNFIRNL